MFWKAIYNDGGYLSQYNEDNSENSYKDIDRTKLSRFELYDLDKLVFCLHIKEGQRLIFRRRNFIEVSEKGEKRWQVILVGYQYNDATGKNHKVLNYIHENGLIELDDHRDDIQLLEFEN